MNETKMLIGSLSNDLFRTATLAYRGSHTASTRFSQEAKRWAIPLSKKDVPQYIKKIANDVVESGDDITIEKAEEYLMYGVLLQNYSLHMK
jgi:hypothetical protein